MLAHGENYITTQHIRKNSTKMRTIHSEAHVLDKLRDTTRFRKTRKVQLFVIRLSKDSTCDKYILKNSRPCADCIYKISRDKFHKITHICYSNNDGSIVREKVSDLLKKPQYLCHNHRHFSCPKYITNTFQITKSNQL